jgi:YHS domain-containing protein
MRTKSFRKKHAVMFAFAAAALLALAGALTAAEEAAKTEKAAAEDTYPLSTCIVTGAELGSMGEPVVYDHEGREIRFCCAGCIKKFEADTEGYIEKMDAAIIDAETEDYPLSTCVVTGKDLNSTGKPVDYVYDNHLVRFCSAGCIKAFEQDPVKYTARIDEARAKQAAEAPRPYPLDTCIVSDAKLGSMGEPVTRVYKGQEVKLCCAGCLPRFESNPDKYMEKLHSAGCDPAGASTNHKSCGGH